MIFYLIVLTIPLVVLLLAVAGFLHLLPRLGPAGQRLSDACCRAPLLDVVVGLLTVFPWVFGAWVGGFPGFLAAIVAQLATLLIWQTIHEAVHADAVKGPRIIKVTNAKFGAARNLTAVYWTAWATPVFWAVRMGQWFIYKPLVWLIHLPDYKADEWINVSRQKFSGLVGHDLIWCLYCDWMTGVWSLGTEMLRNVESFWCPIRFSCEKKCENCSIDFPDVNNGWVPASGTMDDVTKKLDEMYTGPDEPQPWFGHPLREKKADALPPPSEKGTGD